MELTRIKPTPTRTLQALGRLHWGWPAAVGLMLGAAVGWLLVSNGSLPAWAALGLLLGTAAWLGRNPAPRLAAPLTRARVKPRPALPRAVMDGELEMVEVPGGAFLMGSPADDEMAYEDERPQHRVRLSSFRIARTPVTLALYREVMGGEPPDPGEAVLPVTGVSWHDAVDFCNRLSLRQGYRPCYHRSRLPWPAWRCDWKADGYRLPTEAEWEYACRAGTLTRWSFGDDETKLAEHAWFGEGSKGKAHPVAKKRLNPWGLYDMHGNVWEWCWDRHGRYRRFQGRDPHGPWRGRRRMLRGGSVWFLPALMRSARRLHFHPNDRDWVSGFRCVRAPARQH
jgi:formylglycine-generating enzyme required for sulfatase activity